MKFYFVLDENNNLYRLSQVDISKTLKLNDTFIDIVIDYNEDIKMYRENLLAAYSLQDMIHHLNKTNKLPLSIKQYFIRCLKLESLYG